MNDENVRKRPETKFFDHLLFSITVGAMPSIFRPQHLILCIQLEIKDVRTCEIEALEFK